MRYTLRKVIFGVLLVALATPVFAQTRIGTVDLRKVFDGYWKKKQAESQLQERITEMQKEDRNMIEDHKKLKEEYQNLQDNINDSGASVEERDKRKKAAQDKFKQMRDMEETIIQYERTMNQNLNEQKARTSQNILKEIRAVVTAKAKTAGFTLVIDVSGESAAGAPMVLYTNNENDMTDAVLTQLNATAPTDVKTEEKPADKGKADGKK